MTNYFYSPIEFYAGAVLKCHGIATEKNTAWVLADKPGTIIVSGYRGDRIRAADHTEFRGVGF